MNLLRGHSVPTNHQLSGLDSSFLRGPESFPMTLASRHSQNLPVAGAVFLSRIVRRVAIILSGLAEEALGLFFAAFVSFMAIFATIKARLASVWTFTDILTFPIA